MPKGFHRRIVALGVGIPFIDFLNTIPGVDWWHMQETSGSVALATNSAATVPDTRSVALLTIADYTLNANWTNPSGQIARHAASSTATLQQDGILAASKTYQVTITLANRTAGSVTITDGGAAISANEQTTRTITSTGTDFIITPTSDFDGDIDVELILVQQTLVAESGDFPGAELSSDVSGFTFTADDVDGWTEVGESGSDPEITERDSGQLNAATKTVGGAVNFFNSATGGGEPRIIKDFSLVIGKCYRLIIVVSAFASGQMSVRNSTGGGPEIAALTSTGTIDVVFTATNSSITIRHGLGAPCDYTFDSISIREANPMDARNTAATVGQAADGNLELGYTFDGATSFLDFYSAEINSKLNVAGSTAAGTLIAFAQSNTWSGLHNFVTLVVDIENRLDFLIVNTDIWLRYEANNVLKRPVIASGSPTGYFMVALTWDTAANGGLGEVRGYYGGVQNGATLTNLEVWVGNLVSTTTLIGASTTTPTDVHDGDIAHIGLGNRALSAGEIADIFARSGL